jgi:hypothetical protein
MEMGLHEARQQKGAAAVDDAGGAARLADASDGGHAAVADQEVAFDDVEGVVHREYRRGSDQQDGGHPGQRSAL